MKHSILRILVMFAAETIPDNPTNISQCYQKIKSLEKQMEDAKKSLAVIENPDQEISDLVPSGTLSVLDALREVEAKFSEDPPEEKARKHQIRIDAVRATISRIEVEREAILAKQEGMEKRCEAILSKISKVGDRAMKAQKDFYQAIADLEALKNESSEYQKLKDARSNPPIKIEIGLEHNVLRRSGGGSAIFEPISTYSGLHNIYKAVGLKQ